MIDLPRAGEIELRSPLTHIIRINHNVTGQLPLNPEAPGLLIGRCVNALQRNSEILSHMGQEPLRPPRRNIRAHDWPGIAQPSPGSRTVILITGNPVGIFSEARPTESVRAPHS